MEKNIGSRFIGLWACLLLTVAGRLSAQSTEFLAGYYARPTGDTVQGYFDLENLDRNMVKFSRSPQPDHVQALRPAEAARIEIADGNLLILAQPLMFNEEKEEIFVVQVLNGATNLYRGISQAQGDLFFISTRDRLTLVKINKRAPKAFLEGYFPSCRYKGEIPYNQANLLKALAKFAACQYPDSRPTAQPERPHHNRTVVSLGLKGGYLFGKPAVAGPPLAAHYGLQGYGIGALLRANFSSHLSMQLEVDWLNKTIQRNTLDHRVIIHYSPSQKTSTFYYRAPIKWSYQIIEAPLAILYHFNSRHKIQGGVQGGFALATRMRNIEFKQFYTKPYAVESDFPQVTVEDGPNLSSPLALSNNPFGAYFFLGVGTERRFQQGGRLTLWLKCSRDAEFFRIGEEGTNEMLTYRFDLSVGYLFSFTKPQT